MTIKDANDLTLYEKSSLIQMYGAIFSKYIPSGAAISDLKRHHARLGELIDALKVDAKGNTVG
jgi:hypothetical protein